jgi:hypothetical protein
VFAWLEHTLKGTVDLIRIARFRRRARRCG